MLDCVQSHVDDVAEAEKGRSNLEEKAAGVPTKDRLDTCLLGSISPPSRSEAIIFGHMFLLPFLHWHFDVQLSILALHQLDAR